jgi:hypothetical protein
MTKREDLRLQGNTGSKLEVTKARRATKRELIVIPPRISRMIRTSAFSAPTEFSVTTRWEIENQGFNDAKNRYGFEHTCHHEENSVLLNYLLTLWALTIERLYRIRFRHRGTHTVHSAEQHCRILWVSLSHPLLPNTS